MYIYIVKNEGKEPEESAKNSEVTGTGNGEKRCRRDVEEVCPQRVLIILYSLVSVLFIMLIAICLLGLKWINN